MELAFNGKNAENDVNMLMSNWFEELFSIDEKIVYLDADLMGGLKTQELWHNNPQRVFNCGIQEANMVGVAAGLYLAGYKPYIHSFAPFVTRRTYDQLAVSGAYGKKSIHIIGSDAGILASDNGGTHMCFEDIAIMRVIPNACVIDVTDASMFHSLLLNTIDYDGLVYFRTGRRNMPDVYKKNTKFNIGSGKVLKEGSDVLIIASGIMVGTALEAYETLIRENIKPTIIDPVTIKPLDKLLITKYAKETKCVVTAENHNICGGLGSSVAEYLSEHYPVPIIKVGIEDRFGQTGSVDYLRNEYGLTAANVIEAVHKALLLKKAIYN